MVLFERGKVHEGAYEKGAWIDEQGRFVIELPKGGTWGIHIFRDDYQYLPLEIEIDDHQQVVLTSMMVSWGVWMDLTGLPRWPDQPTDETLIGMPLDDNIKDNPILDSVTMTHAPGGLLEIEAMVRDPDKDLSRMVLAYDPTTGGGYALNPPAPPDAKGNYPDGKYSLKVFLDDKHVPGKSQWHFVVSDMMCNDTDILTLTIPPK